MSTHARRKKHNITQKLLTENAEFPQCHNLRMREEAHFVLPCLMMRKAATSEATHELLFETRAYYTTTACQFLE
jgi:hypothetical protein